MIQVISFVQGKKRSVAFVKQNIYENSCPDCSICNCRWKEGEIGIGATWKIFLSCFETAPQRAKKDRKVLAHLKSADVIMRTMSAEENSLEKIVEFCPL